MKRKTLARKYILLATKKPLFFYSFLFAGVVLFLLLTMTTEIETADGTVSLFYLIFAQAGKGL